MRETEEKQKAKKRTVSGVKRSQKETQRDKKRQKPHSAYLQGVFARQRIHHLGNKVWIYLGWILKLVLKTKSCTDCQIRN